MAPDRSEESDEPNGERLFDRPPASVGRRADLRIPGRRHQWDHGRSGPRRRRSRVHPRAPRGAGRLHGRGPRQMDRPGRRLPGDLGSGGGTPAERPVRRQDGPSAGAGDRRPAGPDVARRELPAGDRPGLPLQGRGPRVRAPGHRPRATAGRRRPGRPRGARRAHRDVPHLPQRPAGRGRRRAGGPAANPRHGAGRAALRAPADRPPGHGTAPRCQRPERRPEGGHADRTGRPRGRPRGGRGGGASGRRSGQGASRQGRPPRRPAIRHRLDRAPRHQAVVGPHDGLRHAAHGRLELPVQRVPAEAGPGEGRRDRHRRQDDRHALSDGGKPGRRRPGDPLGPVAAHRAQGRSRVARDGRGGRP